MLCLARYSTCIRAHILKFMAKHTCNAAYCVIPKQFIMGFESHVQILMQLLIFVCPHMVMICANFPVIGSQLSIWHLFEAHFKYN